MNTHAMNDTGQIAALRNLPSEVRGALRFMRKEAGLPEGA
jgi:hypothetical protein